MSKQNWKLFIISNGFYFFGEEVNAPEGYVKATNAAMSADFNGSKGIFGVVRGDKDATISLDRLGEGQEALFPIQNVIAIIDCINPYTFAGTTTR